MDFRPPPQRSILRRMLFSPPGRMAAGIAVCGTAMLAVNGALRFLLPPEGDAWRALRWLLSSAAMLATYRLLFRSLEKRDIAELSAGRLSREGVLGLLGGSLAASMILAVLHFLGYYEIVSLVAPSSLLLLLALFTALSVFEETLFRGILYRILEGALGTNAALAVSALLFGLAHLPNQHADAISVLSAAGGGVLAGLLFCLTRRLWLPIAFHAGWNWAQASLGVAVSGMEGLPVVVESWLEGPTLLTGGAFGPENSILTLFLVAALSGGLYRLAWKRGRVLHRPARRTGPGAA